MNANGDVYEWVDTFQFSRSKKHIARDFSDAVLLAELLAQLFPAWVELHNYPGTNRFVQKLTNWETLNRKVLVRIKCEVSRKQQEDLANAVPGAIETVLAHVRKQTAKNEQQKATFKTSVSPTAKTIEQKSFAANTPSVGLKSPVRYKATEPRTATSPQSLHSPAAAAFESRAPRSPSFVCSAAATLSDVLPSVQDRPNPNDIAASFSRILQLMHKTSDANVAVSGAPPSRLVQPRLTAVVPPALVRRPLTPDSKHRAEKAKTKHATDTRTRPLSAGSKVPRKAATTAASTTRTLSPTARVSPAKKAGRDYGVAKKSHSTSSSHANSPYSSIKSSSSNLNNNASSGSHDASGRRDDTTIDFAESSLVYFSTHEAPPARDELHAWEQHEHVQVAQFVKLLPAGDCLVHLLKADGGTATDASASNVKAYISTPHFIECCSSQLHSLQSMRFDAHVGKWLWLQPSTTGTTTAAATWKRRDLAIDIASSKRTARVGSRTAPARRSDDAAVAAPTSSNTHFFTQVLARVKCNSISLDEPVAVVDEDTRDSKTHDASLCPDFVQTALEPIAAFASPVALTVFPRVSIAIPPAAPSECDMTATETESLTATTTIAAGLDEGLDGEFDEGFDATLDDGLAAVLGATLDAASDCEAQATESVSSTTTKTRDDGQDAWLDDGLDAELHNGLDHNRAEGLDAGLDSAGLDAARTEA